LEKAKISIRKKFSKLKQVSKLTKKMVYRILKLRTILAAEPRIGRVQHFQYFISSSFVNDPFRAFFSVVQKNFDFVFYRNVHSFSNYFIRFLTERSFSLEPMVFSKVCLKNCFVRKKRQFLLIKSLVKKIVRTGKQRFFQIFFENFFVQ